MQLTDEIGYVTFVFADGSRQTIKTTLNKEILREYGVSILEDRLYDMEHAEYVPMRKDAVSIEVSENKPEAGGGLNGFATRFI